MAASDIYTVTSGSVAVATASLTPLLELRSNGSTAKRAWIVGGRIRVVAATSVPAGNTVLFQIARAANTPSGGTSAALSPKDTGSGAAISAGFIGSWATAPTQGAILGSWILPQAPGSMWEIYPPLGYEWCLPVATASLVGFVTATSSTSSTFTFEWDVSE